MRSLAGADAARRDPARHKDGYQAGRCPISRARSRPRMRSAQANVSNLAPAGTLASVTRPRSRASADTVSRWSKAARAISAMCAGIGLDGDSAPSATRCRKRRSVPRAPVGTSAVRSAGCWYGEGHQCKPDCQRVLPVLGGRFSRCCGTGGVGPSPARSADEKPALAVVKGSGLTNHVHVERTVGSGFIGADARRGRVNWMPSASASRSRAAVCWGDWAPSASTVSSCRPRNSAVRASRSATRSTGNALIPDRAAACGPCVQTRSRPGRPGLISAYEPVRACSTASSSSTLVQRCQICANGGTPPQPEVAASSVLMVPFVRAPLLGSGGSARGGVGRVAEPCEQPVQFVLAVG